MKHPTKLVSARMKACRSWQACSFAILTQKAHARKGIGTMAVDKHWRLYYDPAFVERTPVDELAGVLLHETAHLLLTHHKRCRSDMDHQLWNVAADLAINSLLQSAGIKLPSNGLFPKDYELPEGKSAEWYYRELSQKQEQESESESQDEQDDDTNDDQSQSGDEPPAESDDQEDSDESESQGEDDESEEPQADSQETDSGDQEGDEGDDDQGSPDRAGDEPSDDAGDGEPADSDSEQEGDGTPQDDQEYQPAQGSGGSCSDGKPRPWEIGEPTSQDDPDGSSSDDDTGGLDEDDAEDIIRQVAERIEQAGSAGGNLSAFCDGILRPKIDPKRLLMFAIRSVTDNLVSGGDGRFSYRRPARRPSVTTCLRPRSFTPVPKIKVLIDTSGSMDERDYQLSLGLVAKCLNSLRLRDGIEIVTGDTRAAWAGKVYDHSKIKLVGGGGTDMDLILTSIAEQKRDKPDLIICCTDGITGWPKSSIGIPVVACVTREPSQWYPTPSWIKRIDLSC